MSNPTTTKASVFKSYVGTTGPVTTAFLGLRTLLLPLEAFNRFTPESGRIVEIGSGHGLITQYLARRSKKRQVVGYDPDPRRTGVARKAATRLPNLKYVDGFFEAGKEESPAAILIIGVLCLVNDEECVRILKAARQALPPGAPLILSDILKNPKDWRFSFHTRREHLFARVGFVKSEGLFIRDEEEWMKLLRQAGFSDVTPFRAPVAMHSVCNWVCR